MAGQTIAISVLADTAKLKSGLGSAGDAVNKFGSGFSKVGVALGALAAAGAVAVGALAVSAFKAVAEVERLNAQTSAAIASTGGAAGRSLEQITGLADSLERMTGIEAEVISGAQNMLLTFTQIKGDNFDAATKAALDMSVAMGTDMTSAATLVGKALNDPIKGVGALSKVGVQLTEDQKNLVKEMTAVGDVAGAQGIILGVLNEQFGGSAEAFGNTFLGTVEKVKNSFGAISESLVAGLLPAATAGLQVINDTLIKVADSPAFAAITDKVNTFLTGLFSGKLDLGGVFGDLSPLMEVVSYLTPIGAALHLLQPLLPPLAGAFAELGAALGGALAAVLPIIAGLFQQVALALVPVLGPVIQLATSLVSSLVPAVAAFAPMLAQIAGLFISLLPAITPILTAVVALVQPILSLIAPLVTLIGAALTPLIAAFQLVAQAVLPIVQVIVTSLLPVINGLVQVLTGVITFLTGVFTGNWTQAWDGIKGIFEGLWNTIKGIVEGVWNVITSLITTAVQGVLNLIKSWGPQLLSNVQNAWNAVTGFFNSIPGAVKAFFAAAGVWLVTAGSNIMNGLRNGITNAWNTVTSFFGGIPGAVMGAVAGAGSWLVSAGSNIISGLVRGLSNAAGRVTSMLMDIAKGAVNAFKNFFGIKSPSRLFESFGVYMDQGLENGLKKGVRHIKRGIGVVNDAVTDGFNTSLTASISGSTSVGSGSSYASPSGNTYNIHLPVGMPSAEAGRGIVDAIRAYERQGGRFA